MTNRTKTSAVSRLLCALLCILLCCLPIAACKPGGESDGTTEAQSTAAETEKSTDITLNLAGYACVRADKCDAATVAAFMCVADRMRAVLPETQVMTDFVIAGLSDECEHEIVFADTSRAESAHGESIGWRDYIIRLAGTKIVVDGGSIYGLYNGARALAALITDDGTLTLPEAGIYGKYDYGDTPLGAILAEYENAGGRVMSMAHRGDWRSYPENSLPSIVSCIENGVDITEIDVRKTRDGSFILMHDTGISRTTNGSGNVSSLPDSYIARYFLREGDGGSKAAVTEYKIPYFSEILQAVSGKMMLNLDKTAYDERDAVYAMLVEYNCLDSAVFKSSAAAGEVSAWFADIIYDGGELPLFSCMSYSSDLGTIKNALKSYKGYTTMAELGYSGTAEGGDRELCEYSVSLGIRPMILTLSAAYCGYDDDSPVCWNIFTAYGYSVFMTNNPISLAAYIKTKN